MRPSIIIPLELKITNDKKENFKMKQYYYINKENGNLIPEFDLYSDACKCGYFDITEPESPDYLNFKRHYNLTSHAVEE